MKERYLKGIEQALSAYTDAHIDRYIQEVKDSGLREHGFPRLTACIGILIANGRRLDLLPRFIDMMTLCCRMFLRPRATVPVPTVGNEFSVREILVCLDAISRSGSLPKSIIDGWRQDLSSIIPEECYSVLVHHETERITNWAIFRAVSECARHYYGLGGSLEFVDLQLSCQFQWIDENGMYCDNAHTLCHQPIIYDLVPRALFAMLLDFGYDGRYAKTLDDILRRTGRLTLDMMSPNGEVPFGDRSNQFLHNEPLLMVILEYEAKRYARAGDLAIALSCPCPARSVFTVDLPNPIALSLCAALPRTGYSEEDTPISWHLGAESDATYELLSYETDEASATASLRLQIADCGQVEEHYTVNQDGVAIDLQGSGPIGFALPALCFDGEETPLIEVNAHSLRICYRGWVCRYEVSGDISDMGAVAANRNGHYRYYLAHATDRLSIRAVIEPMNA